MLARDFLSHNVTFGWSPLSVGAQFQSRPTFSRDPLLVRAHFQSVPTLDRGPNSVEAYLWSGPTFGWAHLLSGAILGQCPL